MARYVERAENVARFIDVNLNLSLDLGPETAASGRRWFITTGDHEAFLEQLRRFHAGERDRVSDLRPEEPEFDPVLPAVARENARTVREMISSPMWEEINKFYLMVRDATHDPSVSASLFDFFNQVKLCSHLLQGVTDATMSHGEAWHFASHRPVARTGRQDLAHPRRQILPAAADRGRRRHAARHRFNGLRCSNRQRPGNVPPAHGRHRAGAGGRLPDARSALPPGHALLPDQGRGVAAGDHRRPRRAPIRAGRAAPGPAAGGTRLRLYPARSSSTACTSSSTAFQTKLNRVGEASPRRSSPCNRYPAIPVPTAQCDGRSIRSQPLRIGCPDDEHPRRTPPQQHLPVRPRR